MDAELDQILDRQAANALILQRLDVGRRRAMDAHLDQVLDGDVLVADRGEIADKLGRHLVNARADQIVERQVGIAGLRQPAHVRDRHVDHREPDDVVGREVAVAGIRHVADEGLILRERVGAAAAALVERAGEPERSGLARPGELDVVGHVGDGGRGEPREVAEAHAEAPTAVAGTRPQVELHARLPVIVPPGAAGVGRPLSPIAHGDGWTCQGRRGAECTDLEPTGFERT